MVVGFTRVAFFPRWSLRLPFHTQAIVKWIDPSLDNGTQGRRCGTDSLFTILPELRCFRLQHRTGWLWANIGTGACDPVA